MRVKADILGRAVDCLVGAPGAHIAGNVVGALAAVALMDGDVLNAAAGLKNFTALKGRGARFQAGDVTVIDESYNANPASMAAALALLGAAKGRKIAVLGDMLEMGAGRSSCRPGRADRTAPTPIWFSPPGREMKALWDGLPAARRGAYAENSAALAPQLLTALEARRHGAGQRLQRRQNVGDRRSAEGEAGMMLYYLSLLTHTDQLAFFRLFRYLTFRSGAAVMTALAIAFFINPMLIRWLKVKQGKGQPIRSDGPQRHIIEKAGTPTMGGLLILIPWHRFDPALGAAFQSLCLDRADGDGVLRAAGLPGRLLQGDQAHRRRAFAAAPAWPSNSPSPSSPPG